MVSCGMPPGSSGKAVERGRKDERSIATLVQQCRDLADHSADIAAASVAAELEHIEASKVSGRSTPGSAARTAATPAANTSDSGANSEMALEYCCSWNDATGNKYVFKKSPCSSDILIPGTPARIELVNLNPLFLFSARLCCEDTRHTRSSLLSAPLDLSLTARSRLRSSLERRHHIASSASRSKASVEVLPELARGQIYQQAAHSSKGEQADRSS